MLSGIIIFFFYGFIAFITAEQESWIFESSIIMTRMDILLIMILYPIYFDKLMAMKHQKVSTRNEPFWVKNAGMFRLLVLTITQISTLFAFKPRNTTTHCFLMFLVFDAVWFVSWKFIHKETYHPLTFLCYQLKNWHYIIQLVTQTLKCVYVSVYLTFTR